MSSDEFLEIHSVHQVRNGQSRQLRQEMLWDSSVLLTLTVKMLRFLPAPAGLLTNGLSLGNSSNRSDQLPTARQRSNSDFVTLWTQQAIKVELIGEYILLGVRGVGHVITQPRKMSIGLSSVTWDLRDLSIELELELNGLWEPLRTLNGLVH